MPHDLFVQGTVSAIQVQAAKSGNSPPFRMNFFESSPTDVEKNGLIEKEDARMRHRWDKTKRAELGISNHYTSVAALIIHWAKELDRDLNCGNEVNDLETVLREDFNFKSEVVTLDIASENPQHQFDSAIINFVRANDGPARSNLIIVYYTGHGFTYNKNPNELIVSGTANGDLSQENEAFRPQANFKVAELILENASADTLLILDCCSASNIMKGGSESVRSYELMAATGKNMPTPSGPDSYTAALVKSLKTLRMREQPFTTYELNQMIIQQRDWNTSSQLFNRQQNTKPRHIALAPPAKPCSTEPRQPGPCNGYLDIRIAFENKDILTLDQVEKICRKLCKLPKSTGLNICDIEYRGFTPYKDSPQFKKLVRIFRTRILLRRAMKAFRMKKERKKRKPESEEPLADSRNSKQSKLEADSGHTLVAQFARSHTDQSPLTPASAPSRDATPTS